jgi:hypothetical protein
MDLTSRLEALLDAAEAAGVDIRAEAMGGEGGGLCRIRGRAVLFVDTQADVATRYDRTLAALAGLEELEGQYLVPEVRRDLERQGE